jgi:glutamate-1-semialdehyde 2,1-aminomutase
MGNGFPVAAVAGREAIMAVVEPGRVAHGGTYCGNVVAATAAAATLEILETQPVLEMIFANGQALMAGIDGILARAGVPHVVSGVPSMFSVLLGKDEAPVDYRSYAEFDADLFGLLGGALIEGGVLVDDDPREPWFMSYSHDAAVIGETLNIVEDAVNQVFGGKSTPLRRAA